MGTDVRESGLIVRNADPLNCEAEISALGDEAVTPNEDFYIRNHFVAPELDGATWRLEVGGLVERSLRLSLEDLQSLPARAMTVTLECAGNGRAFLDPPVAGEQWALGAVGTAVWTGVLLSEVLARAGIRPGAREVLFKGADGSSAEQPGAASRFDRSLTLDEASETEVLLAYAMNAEPLPVQHGYPVRAIVPGWYGVASVKWLHEIALIDNSFVGHFQTNRYVYEWERDGAIQKEPLRHQRVRALITHPSAGQVVDCGEVSVRGFAWSGVAPVARVDISVNGGAWQQATLSGAGSRHHWRPWRLGARVDRSGPSTVCARAFDEAGRAQPEQPEWNRLGYGNNAIHEVEFQAKK
jgi:DMSO/TMAO reductase YedYZ molybdopterin-dependent catalytic subunit